MGPFTCELKDCGTTEWYGIYEDERSPLGAWIESIDISRHSMGEWQERQTVAIQVRLMSQQRTGKIQLTYQGVTSFSFEGYNYRGDGYGVGTVVQDELNLTKQSFLSQRIEHTNGHIDIEAAKAEYNWQPIASLTNGKQS